MLGVVGLFAAVNASASPERHARERCATRGTTVAENARARIYRVTHADSYWYGCITRTGRTTLLGDEGGGGSHDFAQFFRLRKTRAAFAQQHCLDTACFYDARSVELRTGRTIRRSKEPEGLALDLELGFGGSFALVTTQPASNVYTYSVIAVDSDGKRVLAEGEDIDPHSLAVAGRTVYWSAAGQPHSARLR